ncbi:metalloregulator ArsR/SmtB family transcription factor [Membranicola marinus]|uniref:Metalloregulator ArsR/SmtB family transcription factor n=1 Tax=Membranihabitans marinus TaxID=1227546 RepID=A0A953LCX6_9BACT|nr:metalloregulator ArsR/SmtB family transcription factor [Membranihabitans marinus]MBY5959966.1 metalloregulator ArsR/SmtB family transcription factor [Membranihabitans marinus]
MGISKTELFSDQHNEIAALAKAIGHPARVAILELLSEIEGCVCGDLVDEIGLAQPTISQHLAVLKQAGLIRGAIKGANRCYCIDPIRWEQWQGLMMDFLAQCKTIEHPCKADY